MSFFPILAGGALGFDAAAENFFTRSNITNATQKTATNQLVLDLKAASLWSLVTVLYPFVGGSAASHAENLISSSFPITWAGGLTHNSGGVTGNGTTGYGNTGIAPTAFGTNSNIGLTTYPCRTDVPDDTVEIVIGVSETGAANTRLAVNWVNTFRNAMIANVAANTVTVTAGTWTLTISGTAAKTYYNGAEIATGTGTGEIAGTQPIYILALNQAGVVTFFSRQRMAMAALHSGLDATQAANLRTAVQTFQTTLGRQV